MRHLLMAGIAALVIGIAGFLLGRDTRIAALVEAQVLPPSLPREFARVRAESELSPGETVRLIVIHHPLGRHFDLRCLLYNRLNPPGVQLVCPNATQEQLEEATP